jgi:hypothetical protein
MRGRHFYVVAAATGVALAAFALPGSIVSSPAGSVSSTQAQPAAAGSGLPAVGAGAAGATWVATATRAQPVPGGVDLGQAPDAKPLSVAVAVSLQRDRELRGLIAQRVTLTQQQFMAR